MTTNETEFQVAGFEITDTPVEKLLSVAEIAQLFMQIADTGVVKFNFADPNWQQLALRILAIFRENRRLKALLGGQQIDHTTQPDLHVNYECVKISFGPKNKYELTIPTRGEKTQIAARFKTIADNLIAQEEADRQLELFEECSSD